MNGVVTVAQYYSQMAAIASFPHSSQPLNVLDYSTGAYDPAIIATSDFEALWSEATDRSHAC